MTRVRFVIIAWLWTVCIAWLFHTIPQAHAEKAAAVVRAAPDLSSFLGEQSTLERALIADATDGRWDTHTLLDASLIASGVDDPKVAQRYVRRVESFVRRLRQDEGTKGTPHKRLRTIFDVMHREMLTGGYRLDGTSLVRTLEEGLFNCVSATVLFHCLVERFDLKTTSLEIPGHAMSRVYLPDGPLDVETTCPGWFDLLDDPKRQARLLKQTLGTQPHQGHKPKDRREISSVELVAMIYFNRGVDLLTQKQFAAALAANAKALELDPTNKTAWGNLLATLNNWAIELGQLGQYEEAIRRLEQGMDLDPTFETFGVNYLYLHYQWIEKHCRDGRFDRAMKLIDCARKHGGNDTWCDLAALDVNRRIARNAFEAGRVDQALRRLNPSNLKEIDQKRATEAAVAEVNRWALNLLDEGRYPESIKLLDRAIEAYPLFPILTDNRCAVVMRWAHQAFEQGDSAEAIRRTTYGSTPETLDPILLRNLRYGYHQWISRLVTAGQRDEAQRVSQQATNDPFLTGQPTLVIPPIP